MGSRLKQVNDITSGGSVEKNSKFVDRILNASGETAGRTSFFEVPLEEITPRSINQFRQSRIEKLAKSIRNTNNRLIHPITLVKASDLPKDSDVLQAYEKKGIDVSQLKYIIVSGERRYRAFLLLQKEEQDKLKGKSGRSALALGAANPFDTITACILTPAEAKNESVFYEDSNIESRQLTPIEAILHIKDAVADVTSPEEMRAALIEMNGGSEEGIPKADAEIKKKFRTDKYCAYCLETDLGIEGVSESTIRNHLSILNNCSEKIIDALVAGQYPIREAKQITKYPKETQEELLSLWEKDADAYRKKIEKCKNPADVKEKRVSRIDARKQLAAFGGKNKKGMNALKSISEKLGAYDKEKMNAGITELEKLIQQMDKVIEKTIEDLK